MKSRLRQDARLNEIATSFGGSVKMVEVPPGTAGAVAAGRRDLRSRLCGPADDRDGSCGQLFAATPDIVDIDDSVEASASRASLSRSTAARLRCSACRRPASQQALQTALSGEDVTYVRDGYQKYPVPVRLELPVSDKSELDSLLMIRVAGRDGNLVPLTEIVDVREAELGADHLSQGSVAGRLRHRRHGRALRFAAVRHVRHGGPHR